MAATDLKILKITVESRLPARKKAQIQQNVRQMQRISENCQIIFEEEQFDDLDFLESIEFFEDNEFDDYIVLKLLIRFL